MVQLSNVWFEWSCCCRKMTPLVVVVVVVEAVVCLLSMKKDGISCKCVMKIIHTQNPHICFVSQGKRLWYSCMFSQCKTSAFASTEQVQSKIVLLDGKNLHFDWCLFGASNKDGADLKTGTELVMGFIWCRLLFRCAVTVEDPSVIVLSNRTSLPSSIDSLGTPLLIWCWLILWPIVLWSVWCILNTINAWSAYPYVFPHHGLV